MVDLEVAIKTVVSIRDKAVETAPMNDVALALGYGSATSTPFYRRISAARIFNLLSSKSSLTQDAIDYIRPHDEEMKARILANSIKGIPAYKDLLARYDGKKLNIELVKNSIAKDNNLSEACAMICAKVFESSLSFAGMISHDGILSLGESQIEEKKKIPATPDDADRNAPKENGDSPAQKRELERMTHEHTIFLDKEKSRSFGFTGPLEITRTEYERICKWLEFTMIITE